MFPQGMGHKQINHLCHHKRKKKLTSECASCFLLSFKRRCARACLSGYQWMLQIGNNPASNIYTRNSSSSDTAWVCNMNLLLEKLLTKSVLDQDFKDPFVLWEFWRTSRIRADPVWTWHNRIDYDAKNVDNQVILQYCDYWVNNIDISGNEKVGHNKQSKVNSLLGALIVFQSEDQHTGVKFWNLPVELWNLKDPVPQGVQDEAPEVTTSSRSHPTSNWGEGMYGIESRCWRKAGPNMCYTNQCPLC